MNNTTLIANYLKENFQIEQIKYNMYIEDDIFCRIPVLIFRFAKEVDESVYTEMKKIVEAFQGEIAWTIFESFYGKRVKNYLLSPCALYKMQEDMYRNEKMMSEKEYFSDEVYRELCIKSISDIPNLFKYIQENFKPKVCEY
jgi:hypothetical protein